MEIKTTNLKRCALVNVSGRVDERNRTELAEKFK